MLGHKLYQVLSKKFDVFVSLREKINKFEKYEIFQIDKVVKNFDVTNLEECLQSIHNIKPDYIINCIGIIKQLPDSKNTIKTISMNALLPHQLALIADECDSKLITISTDCVFSGEKGMYTEDDYPDARDLYGKSKNLGEVTESRHLTLRTSIIGRELITSHSLIEWFLSNKGQTIKGFTNAIYSGFPTIIFAEIISNLILNHNDLRGLFHVSSEPINKYDLLVLVKKHFNFEIEIEMFDDFYLDRSLDSTRFRKITGFQSESWDEMIKKMAEDSKQYLNWR